ncbi:VOC family protein [Ensifer sp. ENS02]|uniref:VOC family protein n=1 Tax=Ensifer sp. ENS02 TaxID=2769290 RepID=UPI0032B1BCBB
MAVRFGYTILYVPDVPATVSFYEAAFGLKRRFVHESSLYAEMETGVTALAFASETMAELNGLAVRANRRRSCRRVRNRAGLLCTARGL